MQERATSIADAIVGRVITLLGAIIKSLILLYIEKSEQFDSAPSYNYFAFLVHQYYFDLLYS